jgi:hypothetical protein
VILEGYYYIYLWNTARLIERDLYGFSIWLSNQNIIVDPAPILLRAPDGAAIDITEIGAGMIPCNVADLLVMYDRKLQEHAVKKLRAEIQKEKRGVRGKGE